MIETVVEVAMHQILFIRHVYPDDHFKQCTRFGLMVHQCADKIIYNYISEILKIAAEDLVQVCSSPFLKFCSTNPCLGQLAYFDNLHTTTEWTN